MQKNNTFIVASIILAIFTLFLPSVHAASPSPNPSPSPSLPTQNEITESLKERLKDTIASPSTFPKSEYRGIIGTIKDVIQKTLIVETKDGKKQVTLEENTTILRSPGNATIKQDDVRIDDYVIAIGIPKEDDVLSGKRVIVSTTQLTSTIKKTGYGQVTNVTKSELTVTNSGEDTTLLLDTNTTIKSKDDPSLSQAAIIPNTRIIYAAEKDEDDNLTATTIMLIK